MKKSIKFSRTVVCFGPEHHNLVEFTIFDIFLFDADLHDMHNILSDYL